MTDEELEQMNVAFEEAHKQLKSARHLRDKIALLKADYSEMTIYALVTTFVACYFAFQAGRMF